MPITSDGKMPDLRPFVGAISDAVSKAVRKARRPREFEIGFEAGFSRARFSPANPAS
jgi:hypothetical protein